MNASKILLLSSNSAWSIWNFRRNLIRHLIDSGYRIVVVAPSDGSVANLEALGCDFIPVRIDNKGTNPLRDSVLCGAYLGLFRRLRPFAVLSFTIKPVIYGGLACSILGVPYISVITGLGTAFIRDSWLTRIVERLYRFSQKQARAVLFLNEDDAQLFQQLDLVPATRTCLLPGEGIDLAHFSLSPVSADDGLSFLLIARLLRDKGIMEFVAAARKVKASYPQARFRLLGAIGVENRTAIQKEEVDSWVSEGLIDYLGVCDDVRPHIAAASCVVLPSYREGTPRSMLEAAAMGRPLIATDVPGCRQVLDHGVSGFLCEARSVDSLARAMRNFADLDTAARERMGKAGRSKMEREFAEHWVFERYDDLLSRL